MLRLDASECSLVMDINTDLGKALGDMVVASLWLYAAQSDEAKASLMALSRMIKGEQPLVDVDFSTTQEADDA